TVTLCGAEAAHRRSGATAETSYLPGGTTMEKRPFASVAPENPFETCTIARESGWPVAQSVTTPVIGPSCGAVHDGKRYDAMRVFQLKVPVPGRYSLVNQNVQPSKWSTLMAL